MLFRSIEPGLIAPHIKPLRQRIEKLLSKHHQHPGEALQRIRLLGIGMRPSNQKYFRHIASAVLLRKQLHIHYTRRSDSTTSSNTSVAMPLICETRCQGVTFSA